MLDVKELLSALIGGGALGYASYWLMKIPWFTKREPVVQRFLAEAIAAVVAVLAYIVSVQAGYLDRPENWVGWAVSIIVTFAAVFTASQSTHGVRDLREPAQATE